MLRTAVLVLVVLAGLASFPVSAALSDIPARGTVFLGEQDLDISATGVTAGMQIAHFTAGSNVQTDAPSRLETVADPTSFSALPTTFGTANGAWYTFPGRQLAFYVTDPSLQLRVINTRTGLALGAGAIAGDPLGFRIETNLYLMAERPGAAGAPITIHVRDPTGAEFTSLERGAGNLVSLEEIPVNRSVYETGPVWATEAYPAGSYEVWADCNANGMRDNYNQAGKTTTRSPDSPGVQVGGTSGPSITLAGSPTVTATGTARPTGTVTATGTATVNATATATATPTATVTAATPNATATAATTAPTPTPSTGFGAATLGCAAAAGLLLTLARRR